MGVYDTYGVFAVRITNPPTIPDSINPGCNRFINDKAMVFPCNGQYGDEVAIYSRKFRNPPPGTQKCILVDIGEDKQDIVAFRPQAAMVDDKVVLIPVHGDPNNVVVLTDMSFFTNGCFEEIGTCINPSYPESSRKYMPLGWQMVDKKSGGDCPFTYQQMYRTTENVVPGQDRSNYQLYSWIKGRQYSDGSGVIQEIIAKQTGPLKNMRYLSFVTYTQINTLNPFHGSGGVSINLNSKWYDIFVGNRDIIANGYSTTQTFYYYYVEIDLVTAIAGRIKGSEETMESARTRAKTFLSGPGTYGFYYNHPGLDTAVHKCWWDMVLGTR
jgi:hypothetical protein